MSEKASLRVPVGENASMVVPTSEQTWQARYAPQALSRYLAAEVFECYRYLILECTQKEAWRRIMLMRKAIGTPHSAHASSFPDGLVSHVLVPREPNKHQREAIDSVLTKMRQLQIHGQEINWLAMPYELYAAMLAAAKEAKEGGA